MVSENVAGRLLVATPVISGPPFARSVVLVVEHDTTGAVGVILTLPTEVAVTEVLPDYGLTIVEPAVVFVGGPVSTDTAVVLGSSSGGPFTMAAPGLGLGVIDAEDPPPDLRETRVFAGYSGWSPGQLEAELDEGSWWVLPASPDRVFDPDPTGLWSLVVRSAPGPIAFHAHFPDDPSRN